MFSKFFGGVTLAALAVVAGAQTFYDSSHKVILPSSGLKVKSAMRTHYLINVAPDALPHVSDPSTGAGAHIQPNISGYFPADIRAAYGMPLAGGSNAIAIVDAYNNPTALADFNKFASQFGLPQETSTNALASTNKVFQVVYASGSVPANNSGWAGEIALDIEWAHAVAPKAKIYLVEAKTNGYTDLWAAIHVAKTLPGVKQISMSFGGDEWSTESSLDAELVQAGVTFFASSGDTGGVREYPAESPNVVGVGGTNLKMSGTTVTSETAWTGSGGGSSLYEPRPAFQNVIAALTGTKRGCPDISGVADPATGVAVYSTYAFGGWAVIGGTSLACPVNAAIANVRGYFSASSQAENSRNYFFLGSKAFRDITAGTAGAYTAAVGWDKITGCGSPVGPLPLSHIYLPVGVGVSYGTYVSGVLANLNTIDSVGYVTTSKPAAPAYASFGEYAADVFLVRFAAPASSYAKLYIYLTSKTSVNTTVELWVYDYVLGKYVYIGYYYNTPTNSTIYWVMNPASASRYFDSTRAVHLYVRPHTPGNNATAFTFNQDRVIGVGYL